MIVVGDGYEFSSRPAPQFYLTSARPSKLIKFAIESAIVVPPDSYQIYNRRRCCPFTGARELSAMPLGRRATTGPLRFNSGVALNGDTELERVGDQLAA